MAYLIGTDEAGYGPNFGPLVISASLWQVPERMTHAKLYRALEHCITSECEESDRVWIADSKLLYKPGGGLAALESGVLAAMSATNNHQSQVDGWRDLWGSLLSDARKAKCDLESLPWYVDFDESLPIDADTDQVARAASQLAKGLCKSRIRLVKIVSRAVFPPTFNQSLIVHENKAAVLSHETIGMVTELIGSLEGRVRVLCDKHGGRNCYAGLLQHHLSDLSDELVHVKDESRRSSRYLWQSATQDVEFRFQAKADSLLAAALASMTSKYLRELAMRAFNRFWCDQKANLKPTAGYPADARRFKKQIARVQAGLGISDQVLWRQR